MQSTLSPRRLLAVFCFLGSLLLFSGLSGCGGGGGGSGPIIPPPLTISGKTQDAAGNAVSGVHVTLDGDSTDSATSDANGVFSLQVPQGTLGTTGRLLFTDSGGSKIGEKAVTSNAIVNNHLDVSTVIVYTSTPPPPPPFR